MIPLPSIARRRPFSTYGLVCLAAYGLLAGIAAIGRGYDDGGLGSLAFLLSLAWDLAAFPFLLVSEGLAAANKGHMMPGHSFVVAVIVMAGLWGLDQLWWRYRDRSRRAA